MLFLLKNLLQIALFLSVLFFFYYYYYYCLCCIDECDDEILLLFIIITTINNNMHRAFSSCSAGWPLYPSAYAGATPSLHAIISCFVKHHGFVRT